MTKDELHSLTGLSLSETDREGIFYTTIGATGAPDQMQELTNRIEQHGYRPVLLGDPTELLQLNEGFDLHRDWSVAKGLNAMSYVDDNWLDERSKLDPDYYDPPRGDWPENVAPADGFYFTRNLDGNEIDPLGVLFVPVVESWKVPLALAMGGWNECPQPEQHAVTWKRWEQEYGATIVCVQSDTIEATVQRPPSTRESALALALEQYKYCADIVDQGTLTIENLAASLLNGKSWFFWWD